MRGGAELRRKDGSGKCDNVMKQKVEKKNKRKLRKWRIP